MEFNAEDFKEDEGFVEYIKTITAGAVGDETAELKTQIDKLIGEKRSVTDKMKEFEGLDLDKAKKALDILEKDDVVKRISEGKFDEVFAERTDQLKTKYEDAINEVNDKLKLSEENGVQLSQALDNTRIDSALRKAAIKAGILGDALDDVIVRGRGIFSVNRDGEVESRDSEGNMRKIDDKILTTSRWVETLPKHYWPSSDSANIGGSASGVDVDEKLSAALKSGDMALYRKLRKTA